MAKKPRSWDEWKDSLEMVIEEEAKRRAEEIVFEEGQVDIEKTVDVRCSDKTSAGLFAIYILEALEILVKKKILSIRRVSSVGMEAETSEEEVIPDILLFPVEMEHKDSRMILFESIEGEEAVSIGLTEEYWSWT